jgi:hypothetical protein
MKSQNGNIQWVLNDWQKHKGNITMCEDGFHACETAKAVLKWRFGSRLFVAEGRGTTIKDSSKSVFQEMRLVKEVTDVKGLCVQFAVNCAKRVLVNYEKQYLDDLKPRRAIEAAENWLEKRDAAASDAASDAAYAAASATAYAADAASYATDAAYDTAYAAASATAYTASATAYAADAAYNAASAAASATAYAADAAYDTAYAAASATAYAADAAYNAASATAYAADAAYNAASAAAYKNEKEWQEKHFLKLLEERLDS